MSSDSDSDENMEQFKESLDTEFLHDDLYKTDKQKQTQSTSENNKQMKKQLPSLRRNVDEEDQSFNIFHVTPQFQSYVSKQLAAKLDKQLQEQLNAADEKSDPEGDETKQSKQKKKKKTKKKKDSKGGVKLLHGSDDFVKIKKTIMQETESKNNTADHNTNYIKQFKKKFNENVLIEQCKLVAVEGKDILSKKEVQSWSNRSKAPVITYKKTKKGYELQEKEFVTIKY